MKKATVTAREFQHKMAKITAGLKPGQSVTVTKRGQAFGTFTKASKPRRVPDFLANLEKLGETSRNGQKLIDEICGVS